MENKSETNTTICNKYTLNNILNISAIEKLKRDLFMKEAKEKDIIILKNNDLKIRINSINKEILVEQLGLQYKQNLDVFHRKLSEL